MKKLILSMALLAGLAIVSCSKDDDGGGNCVSCTVMGQTYDVCNENGNAFVGGQDSQIAFDDYIETLELAGGECN